MQKNKKNKKITLKSEFASMNPATRERLFNLLKDNGMSYTTIYYRFNRDGFKSWEIKGILSIIKEFDDSFSGDTSSFWPNLKEKKLFFDFMYKEGMSRATVYSRFSNFNFKGFEITGIKSLIDQINYGTI